MSGNKRLQELLDNPDDKRHGTRWGYQIGCRCSRCIEANRRYKRRRRERDNLLSQMNKERSLKQMQADPTDPRHGTATGYTYGCHCEKCMAAGHEYYSKAARKERKARNEQR